MMERFGYVYYLESLVDDKYIYNTFTIAEEAANEVMTYADKELTYEDVLDDIELLGCDDTIYIGNTNIEATKNW